MAISFLARSTAGSVLLLLPLSQGCVLDPDPKVWIDDSETLQLPADGVTRLSCETHNGAIRAGALAAASDPIEVVITKRAGGQDDADARACMDAIVITQERDGATVSLGWKWQSSRQSGWRGDVGFEVRMPAGAELVASTHNGTIHAQGLQGGCELQTHNGEVKVIDCVGTMRIRTHNGPIGAQVQSENAQFATHNGDVEVRLRGSKPVDGSIRTHNGAVTVEMDAGVSTNLVCTTNSAEIRTERQIGTVTERKEGVLVAFMGTEPGRRFEIETHDGAIVVR